MLNYSLFSQGDVVAVALSGGKDSMFLLDLLASEKEKLNLTVKAINVEHGIRGRSSLNDSEFVRKYCADRAIALLSYSVDSRTHSETNGLSLEQSARVLRYDCFYKAIKSGFCDKVATAHHRSDDTETVLMNIFRGTSVKGLCGISDCSCDGKIVRPILACGRNEIDLYVEKHNIPFVHDETNDDQSYTRNYMRNTLIPLIKARFPALDEAVSRLSSSATCDDEYLDSQALRFTGDNCVFISDCPPKSIFYRACLIVMKNSGFKTDYTAKHLEALYNLCSLQVGARAVLRVGITAYRMKDRILFAKAPLGVDYRAVEEIIFSSSVKSFNGFDLTISQSDLRLTPSSRTRLSVAAHAKSTKFVSFVDENDGLSNGPAEFADDCAFDKDATSSTNTGAEYVAAINKELSAAARRNVLFFDGDKLPADCVIRLRREGDFFIAFGNVRKSLKKYFTDKKIPSVISRGIPLVCMNNQVFVICGIAVSELIKVDKSTTNVIKLSCTKKGEHNVQ